jgi:hypothetical protein
MRTDLNVWLNDTNQTIQQLPFYFANNSSGYREGVLSLPALEVIGSDIIITFMIVQTVIMIFMLYSIWRLRKVN